MRVVFLDMDGVLNSAEYVMPKAKSGWQPALDEHWACMINPFAVAWLNRILAATSAQVVISSSWRYHVEPDRMQSILDLRGFKGTVIGRTPTIPELPEGLRDTGLRGTEIEVWLAKNKHLDIENFAILDDMSASYFGSMAPYLVHTSWARGLLSRHVAEAVSMLQGDA